MESKIKKIYFINSIQFAIGLLTLLLGVIYYVLVRNSGKVYAIQGINWLWLSNLNHIHSIKVAMKFLSPAFLHSCSFSLLTASLLPEDNNRKYIAICIFWAVTGSLFEFGQYFKPHILAEHHDLIGIGWLIKLTFQYFEHGTYDMHDIINTILGCLIAYKIMLLTKYRGDYAQERVVVK
ncbi:hypothetical protein KP004_00690 [Geomonas oryzisoli]|uniref:VanZ-like domain-containing protein n=1 Tax=Geomonas oryzisoli TaxID=2847992 RepID=A0ABX8J6V7_9BACT|nr:hypothetical protein [Geomonas oryzisoli]QWV93741.1 hypothetical protein KP004_00690 [Geomonas oryzisoli]